MSIILRTNGRPRLLVSVRSVQEAQAALASGAEVIDVKEPSRGSLGAADHETVAAVVRAVEDRAPVSAALGELVDLLERGGRRLQTSTIGVGDASHSSLAVQPPLPSGVAYFKVGLAHCAPLADWPAHWRDVSARLGGSARPVAVTYADWRAVSAPDPQEVLAAAVSAQCPALLIDTWGKASGTLFEHWPAEALRAFIERAHGHNLAIVLAGSLTEAALKVAVRLQPDLIAVRGAACEGGRDGDVSRSRVAALRQAIEETHLPVR